jgi:signal transduction histidine kinase
LKSEFLSTVSHELRTPLNVIIGYTEMLRDGASGQVPREQLELIQRIDARSHELLELLEATLHVGRIETGRDAVALTPVKVRELVEAIHAATAGLPRPPRVLFLWDRSQELDGTIVTDCAKAALVVRNLVSNAFKFTAEGRVTLRIVPGDGTLSIEVSDTGVGIPPEQVPVIFEMFRQLDNSPTREHGGVGLGLYIVKQVVNRLGGTVTVDSAVGFGSTFRVTLANYVPAEEVGGVTSELGVPFAARATG